MTGTELARATSSDLAITDDQTFWSDKQIAALRQLGVEDATNGDLAVFFHQAKRTGLDPFARQIYMIGRWSKDGMKYTIQTGIDGFRLIASRTGHLDGYEDTLWCGEDGVWSDVWLAPHPPAAAKVTVIRDGARFPAVALFREYAQTKRNGDLTQMWADKGGLMIAKCAEALALRKAFPQDLSGLYTSDEMGQADQPAPRRVESEQVPSTAPQQQPAAIAEPAAPAAEPVPADMAARIAPPEARTMEPVPSDLPGKVAASEDVKWLRRTAKHLPERCGDTDEVADLLLAIAQRIDVLTTAVDPDPDDAQQTIEQELGAEEVPA